MSTVKMARMLVLLLTLVCFPFSAMSDLKKLETDSALRSVYVIPSEDAGLITVSLVVLAGEVDYTGAEGLSHYLEHIIFWHADKLGDETIHARSGNAWVNGIITTYYNTGETLELESMFEFASRVLTPPALALGFMQEERHVVAREYDLRVVENPDRRAFTDMRKQLYANHPVSRSVIGTPDSILSLTVKQALEFHQQFYHAGNAILFVSGAVTDEQVINLVNEKFSDFPVTTRHDQQWRQAMIPGELDLTLNYPEPHVKAARLAYVALSNWSGSGDALQDNYTVQMTNRLLESALPGSLAKPLRLDNFIVSQYSLGIYKLLDQQIEMSVLAYPDSGVTLGKVRLSLLEALVQQGISGVPEKSLERIRKRWLQTAKRESRHEQTTLWRALQHISLGLEPNTEADHIRRIQAITKADVDKLLSALGNPQRRVSGLITEE